MEVSNMKTVTVSPKYQVVIPRELRDLLQIKPGEKVQVLQYENRLELIPVRSIKKMRGFLKGIDTTVRREKDRV
jgi:AbrB family looped-hinge helix DNA binding protein